MKKALVLVAHADDESLGAGGLIQKLVKAKWNVSVVFVSDGILTVRGKIQNNKDDAELACKILGIKKPKFLGYQDQKFDTYPIADMANSIMKLNLDPDLIITHVETDLNLDHRIVLELAKIIGRPKSKPISILGCEIPYTSFWNARQFPANFFVDITNELETKIKAFAQYKNEIMPYPHPWSKRALRIVAEYHGIQSGHKFAEAYQVIRGYENLF